MDKAQSKFHNTAIKMNQALFELLEQKEFKDISISEICAKAKVNRSTFYAHYDNTLDLLEETQKTFIQKFFSVYKLQAKDISRLSIEDSNFITAEYLMPYLKFIKQHKRLYKVYMENLNLFKSEFVFDDMRYICEIIILCVRPTNY